MSGFRSGQNHGLDVSYTDSGSFVFRAVLRRAVNSFKHCWRLCDIDWCCFRNLEGEREPGDTVAEHELRCLV